MDGSRIWRLQPTFHDNFNEVFESKQGLALDLDDMSAAPLSTILMDLMMYEYPELFEASLTLFKANFSQREALISAMSTVQLMSTDALPIFSNLAKLTEAVALVRTKLESYETWGVENKFSGITYSDRNDVVNNLRDIMRFLAAEPTEPPVDAEPEDGEEEMKVDEDLYVRWRCPLPAASTRCPLPAALHPPAPHNLHPTLPHHHHPTALTSRPRSV